MRDDLDIDEARRAPVAREGIAPDSDAVRDTVLAHPPAERRRHRRRFAAIGIAAAVVLIAGTVAVVRSSAHDASARSPAPAIPSPSRSALASKLDRIYWSIATVTTGAQGEPVSATYQDSYSLAFDPNGTVQVSSPRCDYQTVAWSATDVAVTIGTLAPPVDRCIAEPGAPSSAAAALAAAFQAMTTGPTQGRLDGRSLVLTAGTEVLVFWNTSPWPGAVGQRSIDAAARKWAGFPLAAHPRPIVLLSSAVVLPPAPLPNGDQENALAAGRILLDTTAPTAPSSVHGYPIIGAQAAIAQITDPAQTTPARTMLHITRLQLVDQNYLTDRGDAPLPTWKMTLAESHAPIYVLAVAAAGRFPATLGDDEAFDEQASLTGGGRDITVHFTAHHVSQGGCDRDSTSALTSKETRPWLS